MSICSHFTSTTSTSRTESAITCSMYLKHVYLHHLFLTAQRLHSQSGFRAFGAYLNINQLEHIELLDFAYEVEQPLTTEIMVQLTQAGQQQHKGLRRLVKHFKNFKRSLHFHRIHIGEAADINNSSAQTQSDVNHQQRQYDITTNAVHCCGELLGHLTTHSAKPNSESRPTSFVVSSRPMLAGRRTDNLDISTLQELGTTAQSIVHPQPRWTETTQQQQFQNGNKMSLHWR